MTALPPSRGSKPAPSLRRRLAAALIEGEDRTLSDPDGALTLATLAMRSGLEGPVDAFRGRCVLIHARRQLSAVLGLVGLDGIAERLILAPPDLALTDLPGVIARAGVDAVVSDMTLEPEVLMGRPCYAIARTGEAPPPDVAHGELATEWVLFTSGTTGAPKMVAHSLAGLTSAFASTAPGGDRTAPVDDAEPTVWATFYDVRRYGGLQILLRALLGGCAMVFSEAEETVAAFLARAAAAGVTHMSGTPSHWRRALMSPQLRQLSPRYLRLSGEIADQRVLDSLRSAFPQAGIGHAYASTEAGVGFEVKDGRAGFPAALLTAPDSAVEMRVVDGVLQIRSARTATCFVGHVGADLRESDGFIDTGDMVELSGDRYHFVGRRTGVVNIGGLKVHPEEVEAEINGCHGVRQSLVKARKNAITGAILVADVVLSDAHATDADRVHAAILERCRMALPRHKVPTSIRFVPTLTLTEGGKLERRLA